MTHRKRSKRQWQRSGVAAVEFALIAPLMILFTFALIEVGRIAMVKQTAIHASREGARAAVHPTATEQSVLQRVEEELNTLSLDNATVEMIPASLQDAAPGELVKVRIRIDMASISWIPGFFDFEATEVVAESSMRRESTQ